MAKTEVVRRIKKTEHVLWPHVPAPDVEILPLSEIWVDMDAGTLSITYAAMHSARWQMLALCRGNQEEYLNQNEIILSGEEKGP
jgi:hypothetical protein